MCSVALQMFLTMDALADGGVWAGISKELSLNLVAHTMLVSSGLIGQSGCFTYSDTVYSMCGYHSSCVITGCVDAPLICTWVHCNN